MNQVIFGSIYYYPWNTQFTRVIHLPHTVNSTISIIVYNNVRRFYAIYLRTIPIENLDLAQYRSPRSFTDTETHSYTLRGFYVLANLHCLIIYAANICCGVKNPWTNGSCVWKLVRTTYIFNSVDAALHVFTSLLYCLYV